MCLSFIVALNGHLIPVIDMFAKRRVYRLVLICQKYPKSSAVLVCIAALSCVGSVWRKFSVRYTFAQQVP